MSLGTERSFMNFVCALSTTRVVSVLVVLFSRIDATKLGIHCTAKVLVCIDVGVLQSLASWPPFGAPLPVTPNPLDNFHTFFLSNRWFTYTTGISRASRCYLFSFLRLWLVWSFTLFLGGIRFVGFSSTTFSFRFVLVLHLSFAMILLRPAVEHS